MYKICDICIKKRDLRYSSSMDHRPVERSVIQKLTVSAKFKWTVLNFGDEIFS